jgi:uncharacterized repeat protein (TIGR01451 family)/MYXO-CTERM domain-containing protein
MRTGRHGFCGLAILAGMSLTLANSGAAHASELRFSQTAAGNVVATGNTIGLSKELGLNGPGIEDSIGTFISLDGASVDDVPQNPGNPWPGGTTGDWTLNGSEATLQLPAKAEVLYAELVWGGSTVYNTEDVTGNVNDPVTLSFGGDMLDVSPNAIGALDIAEVAFSGFFANYYVRSAEVTDFVADHAGGAYAVSGIPATQDTLINSLNAGGWTLLVAYRDSDEPIRNLTIFTGGSFVDEDSIEDYVFAGFCTPPSGAFAGRALITTMEGDADLTGDSFQIGPDAVGPFTTLEGPNNPADNFFCSQLNDPSGNLDMAGSFGAVNQNAAGGFNVVGGRQGWDLAQLPVSSMDGHFANGQTEATLRAITTGDSFVPAAVGFAIQVNAPDFSGDGTGAANTPMTLAIGETGTVTVDMENAGLVDATGLVFRAPLPAGLELTSFTFDGASGDIGGNAVDTAGLTSGVDIGDVVVGASHQIVFEVEVTAAPGGGDTMFAIQPQWDYDYISCVGEDALTEPHSTTPVFFDFDEGEGNPTTGDSGVDSSGGDSASASAGEEEGDASASAGETTAADATDTLGIDTDGGGTSSDSGCGCRSQPSELPAVTWLMLLVVPALRRRRR